MRIVADTNIILSGMAGLNTTTTTRQLLKLWQES